MKLRTLLLGAASGLALLATPQFVDAQIWSNYQFERGFEATPRSYRPIENPDQILAGNSFREPQTLLIDRDNGYYFDNASNTFGLNLPFTFRYNTREYDKIHINVNGFVKFPTPDQIIPNREGNNLPEYMFIRTRPNAVIAPFWGDHHWRWGRLADAARNVEGDDETGFQPTRISVTTEGTAPDRVFVIEWHNLNININRIPQPDPANQRLKSSVASFQLKLYETTNAIEFRYGQAGAIGGQGAVINGCAVGLESEDREDDLSLATSFINALFDQDAADNRGNVFSRESRQLSTAWPPSGGTDLSIFFTETPIFGRFWWGDGDANLSKIRDEQFLRQFENDTVKWQRKFVNFDDAMLVMRALVTDIRLDSFRFREAYHADVNRDGRFYYSKRSVDNLRDSLVPNPTNPLENLLVTWRREVPARTADERLGLPADSSRDRLYFQANEFDAALILKYLSAKITKLPWILTESVDRGAPQRAIAGEMQNEDLVVRNSENILNNSTLRVPLFANAYMNSAISLYAEADDNVISVEAARKDGSELVVRFENGRIVIAGYGEFEENEPFAFLTVRGDASEVTLENVRLNNNKLGDKTYLLDANPATEKINVTVAPNPVVNSARINVVAPRNGNYSVRIFDMLGNNVATLHDGFLSSGVQSFDWNVAADFAKSGAYLVRFEGEGTTFTHKVNVVR